jgi:hypothetical protein
MCNTDGSHFISLLTTTLKYIATLSFTERPYGSPIHLHAFASNSHPVFRNCLVRISLDVFMEVGICVGYFKEFHKLLEAKLLQLKCDEFRKLISIKVLHTPLLNTIVVAFKVLPLGTYAQMSAPSPPFKIILEIVLWNCLETCRCVLYLRE